ncbi:hypothetical protein [Methylobacterium gregans]|uniref:Uncharacterized protein n=1 Tax=Methylobacterium gregans TaxID=374424 RepID=A0AA37MB38_9HYPH|nr:hypothetical protein [Methylobacterium gregans]MDQ0521268.1 hypothetical protein [Methylobacterium gregans]GJD78479.1 hypothetical protein NBEOAGPD_1694 [Methylobacterium gregans]GLS54432.1 hypothetical protein GCM10007886_26150 [Methylobacterium gregans]
MTERDAGYVQALDRMVAHCRRLMLDRETLPEGREEHRALIDYMEGQIERMQERADAAGELREAC